MVCYDKRPEKIWISPPPNYILNTELTYLRLLSFLSEVDRLLHCFTAFLTLKHPSSHYGIQLYSNVLIIPIVLSCRPKVAVSPALFLTTFLPSQNLSSTLSLAVSVCRLTAQRSHKRFNISQPLHFLCRLYVLFVLFVSVYSLYLL